MYEYRNPYIVDFSKVQYYKEIHNNVEIYGLSVVREKFDDTADKLIGIMKRWKHCDDDEYCDKTRIFIIEGKTETELT